MSANHNQRFQEALESNINDLIKAVRMNKKYSQVALTELIKFKKSLRTRQAQKNTQKDL